MPRFGGSVFKGSATSTSSCRLSGRPPPPPQSSSSSLRLRATHRPPRPRRSPHFPSSLVLLLFCTSSCRWLRCRCRILDETNWTNQVGEHFLSLVGLSCAYGRKATHVPPCGQRQNFSELKITFGEDKTSKVLQSDQPSAKIISGAWFHTPLPYSTKVARPGQQLNAEGND